MMVRSISGGATFDLTSPLSAEAATHQLRTDGAIVILQRSNITVPMNSLNLIQAREVCGNLGLTTFEFVLKENFMSAAVGEVLFRLHPRYTIGTSKLLVPVPRYEDTEVRKYGAYVATLLGSREKRDVAFHVTMVTARGERTQVSLNGGDILVCTDEIQRSIPQTLSGTAFVSETFYYPPHLQAVTVDEKLRNDYFAEANGELERAPDGSLVWRRERFACRAWM